MSTTVALKQLAAMRAAVETLSAEVAAELSDELAALPAAFGFSSSKEFILAVRAAAGAKRGPGRPPGKKRRRRRRAVITDKTRAEVKRLSEEGKTSGEIAAKLRISGQSVHNIRKALGLVRKR